MAAADYTQVAQELYLAYFGRPADRAGLINMTNALNNAGAPTTAQGIADAYLNKSNATVVAILNNFAASDESKALYGAPTDGNAKFIAAVYAQVLNRVPDLEGLDFWTNALDSGVLTRANAATQIIAAALKAGGDATDAATVANKVAVATNFTAAINTAEEVIGYSGDAAAAQARALLQGVNDSTDVGGYQATVDAVLNQIAFPPVAPVVVTLTNGVDTKLGTSAAETFVAVVDTSNTVNTTLTSGDNLNGGAGDDVVSVTVTGTGTANVAGVTLSNIETVSVQNVSSNGATFNMANATGVNTVATNASSQAVTFNSVGAKLNAAMSNGSSDLNVTYLASVVAGSADAMTLTLDTQVGGTFKVNGIETLNVVTKGGESDIALDASNEHTAVKISGSADLTLDANDTSNVLETVDASGLTGALTLTDLGTSVTKVIGGSGNDTITISASNVVAAATLDGGAGTDTLNLDAAVTAANAVGVKNFETVKFTTSSNIAQDAAAFASAKLAFATGAANTITVTGLGATQGVAVTASTSGAVSTDLKTNTTADTTTFTIGGTAAVNLSGGVTLNNAETISIISNGSAANTISSLVDSAATKLTIAASKGLTISALSAAALNTIDASASTAAVSVAAVSGAATITGGSGNDTFTGSTSNDSIFGGAGNDILTGNGGRDTIDGGAGDDSITGGSGNDVLIGGAGNDTIVGNGGNDRIDAGDGDDTISLTFAQLVTNGGLTVAGGAGTDVLSFNNDVTMDFRADPTSLNNVTGIEGFAFTTISGKTVSVNDGTVAAMGGTLNLTTSSNATNTFDASSVLASTSKVVFSAASTVTAGQNYSLGNGIDQVTLTSGSDTVTVSNNAFLSANDTLNGGAGSDTLTFTSTAGGTISAAQLSHVSGFETLSVNTGGAGNYSLTLTDALVSPNATSLGALTVARTTTDSGTLKVDASAVSATYTLTLTGGAGADTLIGGAGADTITGGLGANVLTGGAGADTFVLANNADAVSTITDFNFGTSSTAVDVISVAVRGGQTWAASTVAKLSGGNVNGAGIAVLDTTTYANAAAAATAANAANTDATGTHDALLIWQDTLGTVHVSLHTDVTSNTATDLATFTGLTITGVAAVINASDFSLV
ncbi:DUF4214 domain-containing protein [Duganella sp. FT94W]|uniref:DUF4214 domain-containing protein n=1 Tax=Duganella lactea TaxID=2692173 RepID=A0ABW9VA68_9BURK|nr:DUF4214 domain-containing protein [Duganella lactea]MYM35559.1 DUF4214 domain-containing protein [Duganella lactea]